MKSVLRTRAALGILAAVAALGLVTACSKTESAAPAAPAASAAPAAPAASNAQATPPAPEAPGADAPRKSAASSAAPDPGPGRGCLKIVADHPYSFRDLRFDETAQALAHASGCFIRYTDGDLAALRIAPVEGRMSIRDAVARALEGSAYAVESASATEIVVAKKP